MDAPSRRSDPYNLKKYIREVTIGLGEELLIKGDTQELLVRLPRVVAGEGRKDLTIQQTSSYFKGVLGLVGKIDEIERKNSDNQ